ncbi:isoprenoid synthase domain-containing protein [Tribonema minus]|uniref:15-cis-phytoene synthase n=1 Tax=Tribonema minus TaxID=303371 RepID=A0A835ZE11_9STRA|nr:isoprenoid synthase domain-containing protein [Tribonema minus]
MTVHHCCMFYSQNQPISPGLALAMENAQKLSEGDLNNVEFISGPDDATKRKVILEKAYEECERITGIFAKTFYLGTKFMADDARKAVWAIYVWCRRTDDIVDGPRAMVRGKRSMQKDLDGWTQRLEGIFEGKGLDALDLALVDAKQRYPTLSIRPFKDMIGGMLLDVPGAGKQRYATFSELEEYCYRVAGTVGLMTLPVLGTAKGITEEQAKEPALSLGIALQLTNILRDVGEDAVRGRIYLPQEDLQRFGVPEDHIMNGILDDNYRKLMAFQIARARYYYAKAAKGVPMLAPESRLPVQASLDMYGRILTAIEENGYDNFRKRAYVSKTQKLLTLPLSWWRSVTPPPLDDLAAAEQALCGGDGSFQFRLTRFDLMPESN